MNQKPMDPPQEPPKDKDATTSGDAGLQAQLEEAKDQGAGKISVPLGETSTSNDAS